MYKTDDTPNSASIPSTGKFEFETAAGEQQHVLGALFNAIKSFLAMSDTPANYVGQALKHLRVNALEDAVEFYAPLVADLGAKIISKAVDYVILPADLTGYDSLIVLVDASGATRNITLPTPANYNGKTITVKTLDPVGNSVITKKSGGTEYHTGYAKGDFIRVTSTGTSDVILDEDVTVCGLLTLTADDAIAANSKEKVFDANYSVEKDTASWWDAVTNHRLDISFAGLISISILEYGTTISPKINGTTLIVGDVNGSPANGGTYEIDVVAGDNIDFEANNPVASTVQLRGDALKNESRLTWRMVERTR